MKLLLVEDAEGMRGLVTTMLKSMGVTDVIQTKHGGEAWDVLRKKPVDLLLTDWNMPIVNGIDLIQKVRREPEFDSLSVLMFTGILLGLIDDRSETAVCEPAYTARTSTRPSCR